MCDSSLVCLFANEIFGRIHPLSIELQTDKVYNKNLIILIGMVQMWAFVSCRKNMNIRQVFLKRVLIPGVFQSI